LEWQRALSAPHCYLSKEQMDCYFASKCFQVLQWADYSLLSIHDVALNSQNIQQQSWCDSSIGKQLPLFYQITECRQHTETVTSTIPSTSNCQRTKRGSALLFVTFRKELWHFGLPQLLVTLLHTATT
jgi:hypothetical protein